MPSNYYLQSYFGIYFYFYLCTKMNRPYHSVLWGGGFILVTHKYLTLFFVNHPIEFVSLTTLFQVFYPDIFLLSPSRSGIMSRDIHRNIYTLVHTILLTLIFHSLEQTTLCIDNSCSFIVMNKKWVSFLTKYEYTPYRQSWVLLSTLFNFLLSHENFSIDSLSQLYFCIIIRYIIFTFFQRFKNW